SNCPRAGFTHTCSRGCDRLRVTIETGTGEHCAARYAVAQALPIGALEPPIVLAMPQVQHPGGERTFLAARPMVYQPHGKIRVFEAPAFERLIEAVDGAEIIHPHTEVARAHALPAACRELA